MRIDCPVFSCDTFWTSTSETEDARGTLLAFEREHWREYHETRLPDNPEQEEDE